MSMKERESDDCTVIRMRARSHGNRNRAIFRYLGQRTDDCSAAGCSLSSIFLFHDYKTTTSCDRLLSCEFPSREFSRAFCRSANFAESQIVDELHSVILFRTKRGLDFDVGALQNLTDLNHPGFSLLFDPKRETSRSLHRNRIDGGRG